MGGGRGKEKKKKGYQNMADAMGYQRVKVCYGMW